MALGESQGLWALLAVAVTAVVLLLGESASSKRTAKKAAETAEKVLRDEQDAIAKRRDDDISRAAERLKEIRNLPPSVRAAMVLERARKRRRAADKNDERAD